MHQYQASGKWLALQERNALKLVVLKLNVVASSKRHVKFLNA